MNASKFGNINWKDTFKAFLTACYASFLGAIVNSLATGHLPILNDLKTLGIVALSAGLASILRRTLTNSEGEHLKPEPGQP